MSQRLNAFARPAFAALALSLVAVSVPAMAEGSQEGLIIKHYDEDYDCQTIKQATRTLKKRNYKMIEYNAKGSSEDMYYFYAEKKNQKGVRVPYILIYDPCDREIVSRKSINEEKT